MNRTFKKWLRNKLLEPASKHYNPNGNSPRAVVSRGLIKEIIRQYSTYPRDFKNELIRFKGLNTPIGYFINILLMIIFAPVLPLLSGIKDYNEAIIFYRKRFEYKSSVK